jgi:hypothetical protein
MLRKLPIQGMPLYLQDIRYTTRLMLLQVVRCCVLRYTGYIQPIHLWPIGQHHTFDSWSKL